MPESVWIGQTLQDRYEVLEFLGQGGMSAVYRALDTRLGRSVAVKIIHPHLSRSAQFIRRFEGEAASVARLSHPNIVRVFDYDKTGEVYFIVFEYVAGESLQARLSRLNASNQKMDHQKTAKVGIDISQALDYAHRQGLIHRDVKPANIMLNLLGQSVLMDFGVVKIVGGEIHTLTGAVIGTARYMAPEQVRGKTVDHRTDIYSLGVTMYEIVSGRPPFDAQSAMTLMMKHVNDPVPALSELAPQSPASLRAIIHKCLQKQQDLRFQTAGELVRSLEDFLNTPTPTVGTVVETPRQGRQTDATFVEPVAPAAAQAARPPIPKPPPVLNPQPGPPPGPQAAPPAPQFSPPPVYGATSKSRAPVVLSFAGAVFVLISIACIAIWAISFRPELLSLLPGTGPAEPSATVSLPTTAEGNGVLPGPDTAVQTETALSQTPPSPTEIAPLPTTIVGTPSPTMTTSQAATPTDGILNQEILYTGGRTMLPGERYDLDSNKDEDFDIEYRADSGSPNLLPITGSQIGLFGTGVPDLLECMNLPLDSVTLPIDSSQVGSYICYETSQGHFGRAQIVDFNSSGNLDITLSALTWAKE